ncbi:5-methyltetrahydropteroyltriglutamate--homocysteine S-methyltransferase [Jeotgalibacillus proteolyticus]|uniref:5-methyltetrahydropteroyltriglutamate-- homocysteine S-methyltransferase n=1 Tax=Jeotgalibacillus proteolyticus TaxID=2082395 RepID=UPI003CF63489
MTKIKSSNLGYPRIGEKREWKKTLEALWQGTLSEDQFYSEMNQYRLAYLQKQRHSKIDVIPSGDFSFYDHVLDTAVMFGLVPKRFDYEGGRVSLSTYFAMARGSKTAHACEMTKWYNTNYHYIVPEIEGSSPSLVENKPLEAYLDAKKELGLETKPVILGPYSFLKLSKGYEEKEFNRILQTFVPVYTELLKELETAGASCVQIDEPALVTDLSKEEMNVFSKIYKTIADQLSSLDIFLQTYFEAVTHYEDLIAIPVKGFGLDFVDGFENNMAAIREYGFPKNKVLAAGMIDGRNIWKSDLTKTIAQLDELTRLAEPERLIIQPSASLLHVPVTVKNETKLALELIDSLAFCDEKLEEVVLLTHAINDPSSSLEKLKEQDESILKLNESHWRKPRERDSLPSKRKTSFKERHLLQQKKWQLPILPATTIGSFPQTKEIRKVRAKWRKEEVSQKEYENHIRAEIRKWIALQEEIGLDVFVHGEFERNDMVEFFGEKLDGFAFSQNGWVQSYGSRCVKPPIIYGNITHTAPMTVDETVFAQSLTEKPVKGMLTGPVTILNWSFIRNDVSNEEVAFQLAEALSAEVKALEQAGIQMIQVDEPALREGLPLKHKHHARYLSWAVEAFRTSTSDVEDTTQIHTHMCYSEFDEIIDAIRDMDADVISIETSRSQGELISSFETRVYDKGIGLGVYDIHSPRVPDVNEMEAIIERALLVLPPALFWVNPDCGLKTRNESEVKAALTNMIMAARNVRSSLSAIAEK